MSAPVFKPHDEDFAEPLAGRDLAAFVAAIEAGTVQGAAERLNLSQSAATKRIQTLERRFGVKLLRRSRSGVVPTEAGRLLYPEGRHALQALLVAERTLTEHRGEISVRIAASHTVGEFLLPEWLAMLRRTVASICPQVDVCNSPRVLDQLRAFEIEVGFVEGEDPLDGLEAVPVVEDEIVVVVARGHAWGGRESLQAAELTSEPLIAREHGSGTRAVAEARLQQAAGVCLTPDIQLSSLEGVKRALPGGGFTLISRVAVEAETGSGELVAIPVADAELTRSLVAVRRAEALPGVGARLLWEFVAQLAERKASDQEEEVE